MLGPDSERRPKYQQAFSSPVIRVFDVVKSITPPTESKATAFVVLPQPILASRELDRYEGLTFVGCTENDGFYALSETSYPYVTDGAPDATFYTSGRLEWQSSTRDERHKTIVGTHHAHYGSDEPYRASLPAPTPISREERPAIRSRNTAPPLPSSPSLKSSRLINFAMENLVDIGILVPILTALIWLFMRQIGGSKVGEKVSENVSNATMAGHVGESVRFARTRAASEGGPNEVPILDGLPDGVVIIGEQLHRPPEPAAQQQQQQGEEAVAVAIEVAAPKEEMQKPAIVPGAAAGVVGFEDGVVMVEEDVPVTPAPTPKKKKAHRGQRGGARKRGKANAEKEKMEVAVSEVKEIVRENPMQVDLSTLAIDPPGEEWDPSSLVAINNLMVHEDKVLGRSLDGSQFRFPPTNSLQGVGSQGTIVYRGSFEGKVVAVKRMLRDFIDVAEHEVSLLQQSDDHPNVIRYYCTQHGPRFLYIALELCPASLFDIHSDPVKHSDLLGLMDPIDVLRQIASGVRHLHSLKIVHRDLKPHNILVSHPKPLPHDSSTKRPRVLISDFGLCKKLEGDKSSFGATTAHAAGTSGWRAPELLVDEDSASKPVFPSQPPPQPTTEASSTNSSSETAVIDPLTNRRATRAIDVFSLGCVFYYILSRGEHPFGTRWHREFNIINNNPDLSHLALLGLAEHEAKDLISSMINHNPRKRPDATKVLVHPFFWSPEKQLTFLLDVSDRFEVEKDKEKVTGPEGSYKSPFIPLLERNARQVCGGGAGDWMKRLDRLFLAELVSNKRRGYDGEKVLDLLRAIRNKVYSVSPWVDR